MSNINNQYALLEQGSIHTDWLTKEEAEEALNRHRRCFPAINWQIAPMSVVRDLEKLQGYLERFRDSAVRNSRV